MYTGPGCLCQPVEPNGSYKWVSTSTSIAGPVLSRDCAFAMYWNGFTVGSGGFKVWFWSVFTMKRLYVPLPIKVRCTPIAVVADVFSTYTPIAKTHRTAAVTAVCKPFTFIFWPPKCRTGGLSQQYRYSTMEDE